jgi:uncharacterized membrane protein HdeD (DUF308 family)
MVFRRHNEGRHSERSGTGPQYEGSGTDPQYEGSGTDPRYQGSGTDPRYQGTDPRYQGSGTDPQYQGTDPRYQGTGTDPRYQGTGTDPRYERTGTERQHERSGTRHEGAGVLREKYGLPGGWLMEFVLGLGTLVLGLIVAFHPTHTLRIIAILLGVLMVISGVYQVVRSMQGRSEHRAWRAIGGVLFFLVGIFLIRHIGLTLATIGLFAGFAFIMGGVAALAEAFARHHSSMVRIWSGLLGVILLAAGISAIVTPINSLARLAIVLGWAFVAIGIVHMIGAFVSRREIRELERHPQQYGPVSVPGQRDEAGGMEYGDSRAAQAGASSAEHDRRRRL